MFGLKRVASKTARTIFGAASLNYSCDIPIKHCKMIQAAQGLGPSDGWYCKVTVLMFYFND